MVRFAIELLALALCFAVGMGWLGFLSLAYGG